MSGAGFLGHRLHDEEQLAVKKEIGGWGRPRVRPIQLVMDVTKMVHGSDARVFDALQRFDLVYSIEVLEHIALDFHDAIVDLLV